ncbi:MAG: recombination protein RecR [Bacteroidales bacterium]|nr:recombination protein RecR [Bacteroidales bacterium]
MMHYSSRLLEEAVHEFAKLPGIGHKTALRLVLYLLKQDAADVEKFGQVIQRLKTEIKHCKICHNLSDQDICQICSNPKRDTSTICVVENIRDVMSIENTHQFNGVYHVLGGVISPMDGIGPGDLTIHSLEEKILAENSEVRELILALPTTMEGDTTNFYIFRRLKKAPIRITTIARGVAVGDDLEYADEITLGRSIVNRMDFESTLKN